MRTVPLVNTCTDLMLVQLDTLSNQESSHAMQVSARDGGAHLMHSLAAVLHLQVHIVGRDVLRDALPAESLSSSVSHKDIRHWY